MKNESNFNKLFFSNLIQRNTNYSIPFFGQSLKLNISSIGLKFFVYTLHPMKFNFTPKF